MSAKEVKFSVDARDKMLRGIAYKPADAHVQRASPTLNERCKGGFDFAVAADREPSPLARS